MRLYRLLLFSALAAGIFSACTPAAPINPPDILTDLNYFPLEIDRPLFYFQDSIVIFNTPSGIRYDTARAEVRETLVEQFTAADGSQFYRGERWQRTRPDQPWRFVQTYTLQRTAAAAFREEDNLRFTKLIFPIRSDRRWNGNVAFDEQRDVPVGGEFLDLFNGWAYRYDSLTAQRTLASGQQLGQLVRVEQADIDNLIDLRRAYEVYAPGIGLVERFIDARATQCRVCCGGSSPNTAQCAELSWDNKAEKGFILHQILQ